MREAGTFSTPSCWRNLGRRKWTSGQGELSVSCVRFLLFCFNTGLINPAKLPKWFGERPGKKPGEPESPDDDDEGQGDAPPGAADEEEEEEEEEEEDE